MGLPATEVQVPMRMTQGRDSHATDALRKTGIANQASRRSHSRHSSRISRVNFISVCLRHGLTVFYISGHYGESGLWRPLGSCPRPPIHCRTVAPVAFGVPVGVLVSALVGAVVGAVVGALVG